MPRRSPIASLNASQKAPVADDLVDAELVDELADDLIDEDGADVTQAPPQLPKAHAAAAPEQRDLTVDAAAHGQRLDVFLAATSPEFSRNHLKGLVEDGCVVVDGQPATSASRKVMAGQRISVLLKPTAQSQAFVAEKMALPIVYEDEHVLVVKKPAGLVVHPAAGNWTGTLMNGLLAHHAGAVDLPRAGIVHRLDKDTSGLMVVGKTVIAVTGLSRAIAARDVSRQYLAIVQGVVPESFTVDSSIGRDPATRVRMAVVPSGKQARTDVRRLLEGEWSPDGEQAPALAKGRPDHRAQPRAYSGVLCTLHTGRTHQIRVHLSSRRHPLVADALYGGAPALGMTRQALHATRLAFAHPFTGAPLVLEAELPSDMAAAWALLENAGI